MREERFAPEQHVTATPDGVLFFSSSVGLGPASTAYKKISGIPRKIFENVQPRQISPFCTLSSRKDHENTQK